MQIITVEGLKAEQFVVSEGVYEGEKREHWVQYGRQGRLQHVDLHTRCKRRHQMMIWNIEADKSLLFNASDI